MTEGNTNTLVRPHNRKKRERLTFCEQELVEAFIWLEAGRMGQKWLVGSDTWFVGNVDPAGGENES